MASSLTLSRPKSGITPKDISWLMLNNTSAPFVTQDIQLIRIWSSKLTNRLAYLSKQVFYYLFYVQRETLTEKM